MEHISRKMIECYFDGSCVPQPGGRMGYGAIVLIDGQCVYEYSGHDKALPRNNCNIAEYKALEKVLDYLIEHQLTKEKSIIKGDSKLVIKQMSNIWKIRRGVYTPHAYRCRSKGKKLHNVKYQWIPRELNERADELSVRSFTNTNTNYEMYVNNDVLSLGLTNVEQLNHMNSILREE